MALLSVSDVLLFFTLVMNAIAIAKPRRGGHAGGSSLQYSAIELTDRSNSDSSDYSNVTHQNSELTIDKDAGAQEPGIVEELSDRAGQLFMGFRRCGVFIAIWNVTLMGAMVFILS
mmetsp:Transcript_64863/g.130404  ORF Transcript_64863/g.130404 Transcript_64863/m.130404 type:complete len:116 (+) Transcript_64863:87-434(+)